MVVNTETDRVLTARRVILELLASTVDLSEAPEILGYMERIGAQPERFAGGVRREFPVKDDNPFYIRDYSQVRHVLALHPGLRRRRAEHVRADLGRPGHRQPRDDRLRAPRCPTRPASSAATASASAPPARSKGKVEYDEQHDEQADAASDDRIR